MMSKYRQGLLDAKAAVEKVGAWGLGNSWPKEYENIWMNCVGECEARINELLRKHL